MRQQITYQSRTVTQRKFPKRFHWACFVINHFKCVGLASSHDREENMPLLYKHIYQKNLKRVLITNRSHFGGSRQI
jgi:hypothetical protein